MKLIILGDIHGHWDMANASVHAALKEHPDAEAVIQLGDLGDGWPMPDGSFNRWPINFDLPIFVVDGNHENFDALEAGNINPRLQWQRRGAVGGLGPITAMFFGGATSPDFKDRTIGRNWWPQESITREQLDRALVYHGQKINVMFCHERADCFPIPKDWNLPSFEGNPGLSDRIALGQVVEKLQPTWYFHGHWHFGHKRTYYVNHFDGCISRMPKGPRFDVNVVSCPVIHDEPKWTVFDGTQIWKNWL